MDAIVKLIEDLGPKAEKRFYNFDGDYLRKKIKKLLKKDLTGWREVLPELRETPKTEGNADVKRLMTKYEKNSAELFEKVKGPDGDLYREALLKAPCFAALVNETYG